MTEGLCEVRLKKQNCMILNSVLLCGRAVTSRLERNVALMLIIGGQR